MEQVTPYLPWAAVLVSLGVSGVSVASGTSASQPCSVNITKIDKRIIEIFFIVLRLKVCGDILIRNIGGCKF